MDDDSGKAPAAASLAQASGASRPKPKQRVDRKHNLRGDAIRKGFERGGGKAQSSESYSEFFERVDSSGEIVEHRDPWLANRDDIYLLYCHLTGAGFRVDAVLTGRDEGAYYVLASRVGSEGDQVRRTMVPVSVGCSILTSERIHCLVAGCPEGETENHNPHGAADAAGDGKEVTLAFVDSDSVHLLPVANTLVHS